MKRLFFLFLFFPLLSFAAPPPTHEYHLKNGLTLIVREDHRAPLVLASIWYHVGGSNEHDGITGISHMLEHMMFKGTELFGPGEIPALVAKNGGTQNAFTSADFTGYYQFWNAKKLPLSFKIESDRMHNLLFDPKLYKHEHQVVMEERRLRVEDNPIANARERFNAAAYINSPYHHPVIGWMTDIKHLTLAELKNWYHQWYQPNNAFVVVVGDVNPKKVLYLAQKYFGPIKRSTLPIVKPRTEIAAFGKRSIKVSLPAKLPILMMGYQVPTLNTVSSKGNKNIYALTLLSYLLGENRNSLLMRNLVRKQQVAVEAGSDYNPLAQYSTILQIIAVPTHNTKALKKALLKQIAALKTTPLSNQYLSAAKVSLIADKTFDKDSIMSQLYNIGIPVVNGHSWNTLPQLISGLQKVTPAQIQATARTYLTKKNLTVATLVPTKKGEHNEK